MQIIIACDSFKDALPAFEVCQAIAKGIQTANPDIHPILLPMADGGEGTAEILTQHLKGTMVSVATTDALFRPIHAQYGLSEDGKVAIIDMAQASGLQLLGQAERNPMLASSFGTGELIRDALQKGVKKILLGIGGSATNDAGMGMASALGYRFMDKAGKVLKGTGADLQLVHRFEKSTDTASLPEVEVLCDVENPLFGPDGAAFVYGKQKGGSPEMLVALDDGLQHFSTIINPKLANTPGAGAAGGLGFGALAFLNAKLRSGIESIMEYSNFEHYLKEADLVITGEGKIDHQTLHGKLIAGICKRAKEYNVPVIALSGSMTIGPEETKQLGLQAAFSILNAPMPLEQALVSTERLLQQTAFNLTRSLSKCSI